ncbi:hypothetical protein ACFQZ4_37915 [Catellatospora coxensis]|uniref:Uncharacterized protein n=1 Tax=Catellatospora coxensis TaxID=310354 RepID=A0A8J3KUI4_9ACTN|nr:hypothetical protein [Catellatospora coxensis]GIG03654.1 hypothetical protein Cco03nite_03540 [Catellatospora coxensis]
MTYRVLPPATTTEKEVMMMMNPLIIAAVLLAAVPEPKPKPSPSPSPQLEPWADHPPDTQGWLPSLLDVVRDWAHTHRGLLTAVLVLAVAAAATLRVLRARRWLAAVRSGTWLEVVPPRQTRIGQSAAAWKLLAYLATRADSGLRLAKPPMAMEVHADDGRLALTVWVPPWVSAAAVAKDVRLAWPGALTREFAPSAPRRGWHAAGFELVPTGTDLGPLVDDTRLGADAAGEGDPLRAVFEALRSPGGPNVLQVLVRPAPGRRIRRLKAAARRPVEARRGVASIAADGLVKGVSGAVTFALDMLTDSRTPAASAAKSTASPPDALQRAEMRHAAEKLTAGSHLLVAIRTLSVRPARSVARTEARSTAHGFVVAANLRPRLLRRAGQAVAARRATGRQWLLASAHELAVLLHFPTDPARHGFDVAARTRLSPRDAAQPDAEPPTAHTSGWTHSRWSAPEGLAVIDDDDDPDDPFTFDDGEPHP